MQLGIRVPFLLVALSALALLGCSDDIAAAVLDDLPPGELGPDSSPDAHSTPRVLDRTLDDPVSSGDQRADGDDDEPSTCPRVTMEGNFELFEGGCTDREGREWFGRATVWNEETETTILSTITYEGYGRREPSRCAERPDAEVRTIVDGTFNLTRIKGGPVHYTRIDGPLGGLVQFGLEELSFDVDRVVTRDGVLDDCREGVDREAIRYSGQMKAMGDGKSLWSGSGSLGSDAEGRFDVRTDAELLGLEPCSTEPLSGTTTVTAGERVAVVTYDGATDCDDPGTATWTLDGVAQGELTNVRCSASPAPAGSPLLALAALGLALALRLRRAR